MGEIFLILFFIYFILLSGATTRVLGCDLQKKMRDSPLLNHSILFFSVFIFAYVLDWFNFYGIGETNKVWDSDKKEGFSNYLSLLNNDKRKYLTKAFFKGAIIYFIFILTTKISGFNITVFLIYSIIAIITQMLLKSHNLTLYNFLNKNDRFFVKELKELKENKLFEKEKYLNEFLTVYNGLSISYVIMFVFLCFNSYKYYLKQKKEQKKFSLFKFWLGTNKCKGKFI